MAISADVRHLFLGFLGIVVITLLLWWWPNLSNSTTVALGYLIVVLLVAATSRLWVAVSTSIAAMLAFNFFFLPPVGAFVIADPHNWIALFAFLVVSLVASNLSAVARDRTRVAETRRDELARLLDLSRDVLLITNSEEAHARLAGFIARRFDLECAAICLPQESEWVVFRAGPRELTFDPRDLSAAFTSAEADHRVTPDGVSLIPLRLGTKPIGVVAAAGRPLEPGTFDAVAGIAAIAIERAQFLDDRKSADLARQSEALKSALLASLGHDLRTPLTAIRVAASNLQASWPNEQERREQSDIILAEVDQLTRLFQNILEMARIDAGAVAEDTRWVAPSEIVDAARNRVEHTLRGRNVRVSVESDRLARLDPRLAAAALSQLLENAAQYSSADLPIDVTASMDDSALTIAVRDHGPGIPTVDLPHVFERFYRGANAKRRAGTGMGLAIARGVLAVERGTISAENCPDGGARFTMTVPVEVK